jgi:hypothetical protein
MNIEKYLTWVIECRGGSLFPRWEAIAAFNCSGVALRYADECQQSADRENFGMRYRVVNLNGEEPQ